MADEPVGLEAKNDDYAGKRLYPPGLLAAYTILLNAPRPYWATFKSTSTLAA